MKKEGDQENKQTRLIEKISSQEKIIKNLRLEITQLEDRIFQLTNLIDNVPGDIYWKNKQGIWSGVNQRGAESLIKMGIITKRSDVIGKSDHQLFNKETADIYQKNDLEVMNKKKEITNEEINILPNGSKLIQLSTKRPLWDKEGNVVGIVGSTIDISYLKKIEADLKEAKEKTEAANYLMTEFISNMGHILVTPLSKITGVATELLYGFSDKYLELKPRFEELMEGCVDWDKAYNQVIKATSLDEMKLKLESFSVNQELQTIGSIMEHNIGSKPLKLIIQPLKTKGQDLIVSDRLKFHLIFIELLSNAIKFTEKGTIKVSISKQEVWFIIKVADTGIGIPPNQLGYIFKQYTMLSRAQKHGANFRGVGAGLFLTEHRAKLLGATLTVTSKVGKGSVFTLQIPVKLK